MVRLSLAIGTLCMWIVPHVGKSQTLCFRAWVYVSTLAVHSRSIRARTVVSFRYCIAIELAGFRILVHEGKYWVWRKDEALRDIYITGVVAISFWTLAYILTSIGVALSTKDM